MIWMKIITPKQQRLIKKLLLLNKIILLVLLPPSPNDTAVNLQPSDAFSGSVDASIHNPSNKEKSSLNASLNAEGLNKDSSNQLPESELTISILRHDYQAAAAPNLSLEFIKQYPTN